MIPALVVVGGGLGALGRYALSGFVQQRSGSIRPWGTAAVNLTGALLLGIFAGYLNSRGHLSAEVSPLTTGFLGGYTTFSTWMVETLLLGEEGAGSGTRDALVNLVGPTVGGLALAGIGYALGTLV